MKQTFRRRHLHLLLVLILFSFVLISLNIRGNPDPLMLADLVQIILAPAQRAVHFAQRSAGEAWSRYLVLIKVQRENARLRKENNDLRAALLAGEEQRQENERLRRLLALKERTPLNLLGARVIGHAATNWSQTIVLDRGRRDGVQQNMAVVNHEGIVGHIIAASYTSSQVLLITDVRSAVDGIIQRTRANGVLVGRNSSLLRMNYVPLGDSLRLGDRIVSSGQGGIFPPGLLIGHVNAVHANQQGLFQIAEVVPSANLKRLEEVLIVLEQPAS